MLWVAMMLRQVDVYSFLSFSKDIFRELHIYISFWEAQILSRLWAWKHLVSATWETSTGGRVKPLWPACCRLNPLATSIAARPEMKNAVGKAHKTRFNYKEIVREVNIFFNVVDVCVGKAHSWQAEWLMKTLPGSLPPL